MTDFGTFVPVLKERILKKRYHYDKRSHTHVVLAYGESSFLEECIESLLAQTVKTRIVLATSTPNDFIKTMADRYQLPLFVNPRGSSLAGDWDFALHAAGTPIVTLAHQDDIYHKYYTADVLKAANKSAKPLIIHTDYWEIREDRPVENNRLLAIKRIMLLPMRLPFFWKSRFMRRRILSLGNAICCPSVSYVVDNLEGFHFRRNMSCNVDWQAWEEISRRKGSFVYVSSKRMGHRIHKASATSEMIVDDRRHQEDLAMYKKFWPAPIARILGYFYGTAEGSNKLDQE